MEWAIQSVERIVYRLKRAVLTLYPIHRFPKGICHRFHNSQAFYLTAPPSQIGIPFLMGVNTVEGWQSAPFVLERTRWPFGLPGGGSVPECDCALDSYPIEIKIDLRRKICVSSPCHDGERI
jgi:hypothetical protein